MRLRELRAESPGWSFTAERSGFGWRYVGQLNGKRVTIYRVAILVGEDDFETQWRVDDGITSESYVAWWLKQNA